VDLPGTTVAAMGISEMRLGDHTFACERELIDVSMLHRPDETWRHIDAQGHEHRWYANGQPVTTYAPNVEYTTPTLIWVKDGETWYADDDEPHEIGHTECAICGEHVRPGYTSDSHKQYIAGLAHYYIDDQPVPEEEFKKRLAEFGY
jgi:hypothetical protein